MSGASSAYSNGMIADRARRNLKRKDLDIHELLNICSEPTDIDDRVELVKKMSVTYPELKLFLIVAYFYRDVFKDINEKPLNYIPSRVSSGASQETLRSMWSEVTKIYDTFPSSPRIKRARAQGLLGNLYIEDAKVMYDLFTGKFYRKELNELVVQKAFPEDIPQSPKS